MSYAYLLFVLVFGLNVSADVLKKPTTAPSESEIYFELMPLQSQYRYEDTVDQSRATQRYDGWFNFGLQYNEYRTTYTQSLHYDKTGNATLAIEKKNMDQLLSLGYRFFRIKSAPHLISLSLEIFGNAYAGLSQTDVVTKLYGNSTLTKGDPEAVFGLGSSVVGRAYIKSFYALAEAELKLLYSNNMIPQTVPAFGIKLGLGYNF